MAKGGMRPPSTFALRRCSAGAASCLELPPPWRWATFPPRPTSRSLMTGTPRHRCALNVARGDKVLEVGTGSGYQSAYLANLTDKVWSIEIIKPLAERTRRLYGSLIEHGYDEYKSITTRHADGYYGWEQEAPFDKVIVTCAIDHIPPPLLQQMKPNGIMVIPVGPPGAQYALKVTKQQTDDGSISTERSDIYYGGRVSFVPFTRLEGDLIKGTPSARDWRF